MSLLVTGKQWAALPGQTVVTATTMVSILWLLQLTMGTYLALKLCVLASALARSSAQTGGGEYCHSDWQDYCSNSLGQTTTEFWPGKDCAVDPDIGLDDPNNVYSCKPEEECCTKELKPACCAAMPTEMMIEDQISLWVPLASKTLWQSVDWLWLSVTSVIILVLGLFVWFCRSDASLLDGETPCLQKFCSCCGYKKRGDDGHLHLVTVWVTQQQWRYYITEQPRVWIFSLIEKQ